uniref:ankyrin repeat and SOCS box protein 18 n=1 Tax=Ictidomys tridecemlineatus TaxID=43179 RepID=UPI001A9DA774|nr:ankyrin repeat and SOCS box protein 18 [Ictidomys tridecemlineatus]
MSSSDDPPDYPVNSDLVRRLKAALDANDERSLRELIGSEVEPVDAVIELANDDWMKDPSAQLPSGALLGDLDHIQPLMDQFFQDANIVFEISKDEMEWQVKSPATFGLSGLWTLEYKRELTTPLCIAAAHGHTACVRHLLSRGAHPDASPGGRGPLHEACLGDHTACARLLLQHGADPDLPSAEGTLPLGHVCSPSAATCAQALLEHGASVQLPGGAGGDTPLHVAAQHGLDEHAHLYLGHGARVDARNRRGETALSLACGAARKPDEHARCLRLSHQRLAQVASYSTMWALEGVTPGEPQPSRPTVPLSPSHQVLRTCAPAPGVIEVLFNSYAQLHVSESWKEMIPDEVYQMHEPFYQSFFALAHTPRCLQHLCRCAIRRLSGKNCFHLIPLLPLPKSLQDYLLLEPEGVLH